METYLRTSGTKLVRITAAGESRRGSRILPSALIILATGGSSANTPPLCYLMDCKKGLSS